MKERILINPATGEIKFESAWRDTDLSTLDELDFIGMGFGDECDIVEKLPPGEWVLIRDDDAAITGGCPWWGVSNLSHDEAVADYKLDGGTVSYSTVIRK